jgi:hypothetical protein
MPNKLNPAMMTLVFAPLFGAVSVLDMGFRSYIIVGDPKPQAPGLNRFILAFSFWSPCLIFYSHLPWLSAGSRDANDNGWARSCLAYISLPLNFRARLRRVKAKEPIKADNNNQTAKDNGACEARLID